MTSNAVAARALAAAALCVSLAACASTDPAVDIVNGKTADDAYMPYSRTALGVSGSGRHPVGTGIGSGQPRGATPPPGSSRALDPDSPWFGELGVSHAGIDRTEL